ncbi:hypothetical protein GUITHDRAFT_118265 [Guillardia theta CCMP2712]|uniref:Uncharacterized protein n=1 Tax=Guillardia theta (strain CCMP2712) TaxID=905079 RepID=L1IH46_GUITC|nr:hypothetical protein GUITHDRAFT_118265 [Guillardia theta CCMP2712]EKX35558.1 hypothetical protein GUITHDRAFT_118265 [Guillardia theta CCMP2712]|eukprot:XP_005822538.1 hypothetical protein GUITHDRAFT_118265 [Guillardia theta CCMP2712]
MLWSKIAMAPHFSYMSSALSLTPSVRLEGSYKTSTGSIIDRYIVPQRGVIPVRSVIPEVQQYQVHGTATVPEVKQVQVPRQRMVQVKETVMVPQTRIKMVPETVMTTQQVTTQKPVRTVQTMQRTVNKVVEGQKIVESQQVLEYERPKLIQGRFLGVKQTTPQEVDLRWTTEYYQQESHRQQAVTSSVPSVSYVQSPSRVQYVTRPAVTQYMTQSTMPYGMVQSAPYGTQQLLASSSPPIAQNGDYGFQYGSQMPYQQMPDEHSVGPGSSSMYGTVPGYSSFDNKPPAFQYTDEHIADA